MSEVISFLLGAFVSWLISMNFYSRSKRDANKQHKKNIRNQKFEKSIDYFLFLLKKDKWKYKVIDGKDLYIFQDDPVYQIDISDEGRSFSESWTAKCPDKNAKMFDVKLLLNSTVIETYKFVSADGGRYIVPLPERTLDSNKNIIYTWRKNSPQHNISDIIGDYYSEESLADVANFFKIDFIEERITH